MNRSSFRTLRIVAVFLALLVGSAGVAWAQNAVLRGTVRSDVGELVEGASVIIPEMAIQSATAANGQYMINIAAARVRNQLVTLRFRMIGFRPHTQTITIRAGEQVFDVSMPTDINRLEDVVITGVMEGTPVTSTTFSIGRLDVSNLSVPAVNPLAQLAGQMPGVSVNTSTGRPGATPDVMLRGPTSINAAGRGQQPLYIVDGIIITGGLPEINPQDIENIEVVKGAAGASLYGARASNGVINIATRSGRTSSEGLTFRLRSEAGFGDIERSIGLAQDNAVLWNETGERVCILDTTQPLCARTASWLTEAARINNVPGDYAIAPVSLAFDPGSGGIASSALRQLYNTNRWPVPTYDAVRQVMTSQPFINNTADATGRVGSTQYFASLSQLRQAGAIRYLKGYDRYTARLNVDQRVGSNLSLSFRSFFSRGISDGQSQEGSGAAFFRLTRVPAAANLLQTDTIGRLYVRPNIEYQGDQNENPLISLQGVDEQNVNDRFIGGGTLRWTPLSWVDLEGNFSYENANSQYDYNRGKGYRTTAASRTAFLGYYQTNTSGGQSYNTSLNLALRHNFGTDLVTRWNFRYLYERHDTHYRDLEGGTLKVVGVEVAANVTASQFLSSSFTSERLVGMFAGVNLEYKQRYIGDFLIRRDGSSLFGSDNRWATFGRASVAYRVSQEPWWPLRDAVNEFKIRASYGTAGGRPTFSAQYETYSLGSGGSLTAGTLGNNALRPETNVEHEIGTDMELFRRVGVNLTYSKSETRDQILPINLPAATGFQQQWQNAGTLTNTTYEASINIPVVHKRDVSWSWRFNYDRTRTVITKLDVLPFRMGTSLQNTTDIINIQQGERYGAIYGDYVLRGGDCGLLPSAYQSDCGTPNSSFQTNTDGYLVWVGKDNSGNAYSTRDGITKNLWMTQLPGSGAPWGVALNWGMLITQRDSASGAPTQRNLGTALPDWRFSISQNFQWRRLTVYGLLEGVMGRHVWNQGRHWSYFDLINGDVDQRGVDVGDAKPIGYYWRSAPPEHAAGIGGMYHVLKPTNITVEDASYAKLRELSVTYHVGRIGGIGSWDVSLIGRNVFTITKYRGFDPEVGIQGLTGAAATSTSSGSGTINAIDAYTFPNQRTLTVALSTSF